MTPAAYARLRLLFHQAVEMQPEARETLFAEIALDDPGMTSELRSLLSEHERPDAFPEGVAEAYEDPLPEVVGNYRIERELGAGGSGSVYLAARLDDEFHRPVAIKVLERHPADRDFKRRLALERRALAQLDHPNIAHLHDWGEAQDGKPYLVMEYVEGQPIREHCRAGSVRDCLRLFLQVCAAVQHAHGRLIVHRDLKPANIFVRRDGTVKLLDFGIAKLLDNDDATVTALRLTPAYASPEQVRGETIGTASDIYSLGVVLYELVTGDLPYRLSSRTAAEASAAVLGQEAPRPAGVDADLGYILLKSLRKEPERRYESAGQLAEDIERFMEGQPVRARGGSGAYVLSRFIRRNRTAFALGAGAVILLAAAAAAATWNLWLAEQRYRALRGFAHSVLSGLNQLSSLGQVEEERQIAGAAVTYLDDLSRQKANDDELQMDIAGAYDRLGDAEGDQSNPNRGDSSSAQVNYRAAHTILLRLWKAHPDNRHGFALLWSFTRVASVVANPADAVHFLADGVSISDQLLERRPADPMVLVRCAMVNESLGKSLLSTGDLKGALDAFRKAENIARHAAELNPKDPWTLMVWSVELNDAAKVLQREGDLEGALASSRSGVEEARRARLLSPTPKIRRETAFAEMWVTGELRAMKRYGEAAEAAKQMMEEWQQIAHDDPSNDQAKGDLADGYATEGDILSDMGNRQEAIVRQRLALRLRRERSDRDPHNVSAQRAYARSLIRMAKEAAPVDTEAGKWFAEATEVYSRVLKSAPSDVDAAAGQARAYRGLAESASRENSPAEARKWLELSVALWRDVISRDPLDLTLRPDAAEAEKALQSLVTAKLKQ